jgi:hypothetical protein
MSTKMLWRAMGAGLLGMFCKIAEEAQILQKALFSGELSMQT